MLGEMHSQEQHDNQTKIEERHRPALCWRYFEITALFFSAFAKKRINPGQRSENHQPDNKVRKFPAKPEQSGEAGEPEPAGECRNDSAAIKHPDRDQVE